MARTKKLQMQPGTDEVNQGATSYKVALGADKPAGYVEVPADAAEHLLRQGGAVEIKDDEPLSDSGGDVFVCHESDPDAGFHFGGRNYNPGDDGKIKCPLSALPHIESHGFRIIENA